MLVGCLVTQLCPTLFEPMDCSTPGFPVLHYLPKFAQTRVRWVTDAIQPSHPLLPLLFLPSIFPSIWIFSNESAFCIMWPKYLSFSLNISCSNEYSRLISFRVDWFDLIAIQGTLKSLLQHHSSKASILGAQPSLWSNSHIHNYWMTIHDYWKNHSFDCTEICQQSDVSVF